MLKAKTKTHKFRKIADDLRSDVKAPLVEALEKFYKNPMVQFHISRSYRQDVLLTALLKSSSATKLCF